MNVAHESHHRLRRAGRGEDPVLYPAVRGRDRAQEPGWWRHLRETLADYLTTDQARREMADRGVRSYQDKLARRSRAVLEQRTREGWWLGPAPYGYALEHHWVENRPGRWGWRHRLTVDNARASIVPLIFHWSLHETLSDRAIARRLTDEQHPPPLDPITGHTRPWAPSAVRTILDNPVHLGYVVRDRTRRGQIQPPESWTWSTARTHRALIEPTVFWAVHASRHPGARANAEITNTNNGDGRQHGNREAA
ncbi:recombinase family protein [Amycolatopsis sp. NPDC059021]|uniref:recombinase family protein n=1 Tax=Amycolatopsis sp. NPDC059021 TaxID=3346704 RepID=UPI00366AC88C